MAYRYTRDRLEPGTYHVFNQAFPGVRLFRDDEDRLTFESMINRHLSKVLQTDDRGRPYVCLRDEVRMSARNVLTTHYHLVLVQKVPGGIAALMRRVMPAYTRYYHRKYGTSGPLCEKEYSAIKIVGKKSLKYRIAYVNANHKRLRESYEFSTHSLMLEPDDAPTWLEVKPTLRVFGGLEAYLDYMQGYNERRNLDDDLRVERP